MGIQAIGRLMRRLTVYLSQLGALLAPRPQSCANRNSNEGAKRGEDNRQHVEQRIMERLGVRNKVSTEEADQEKQAVECSPTNGIPSLSYK
jgi:hypothetical protein